MNHFIEHLIEGTKEGFINLKESLVEIQNLTLGLLC